MTTAIAQRRDLFPVSVPGLRFAPVAPDLWRVLRPDGAVAGHIRRHGGPEEGAARYAAQRMRADGRGVIDLGEFWSGADAAEVFR